MDIGGAKEVDTETVGLEYFNARILKPFEQGPPNKK